MRVSADRSSFVITKCHEKRTFSVGLHYEYSTNRWLRFIDLNLTNVCRNNQIAHRSDAAFKNSPRTRAKLYSLDQHWENVWHLVQFRCIRMNSYVFNYPAVQVSMHYNKNSHSYQSDSWSRAHGLGDTVRAIPDHTNRVFHPYAPSFCIFRRRRNKKQNEC